MTRFLGIFDTPMKKPIHFYAVTKNYSDLEFINRDTKLF